ncbi:MAG: potassium-transporting ATPase subunit KdpA, partial [Deltaproteobacteria bacterium]|nr:potassium-transporting ATPase subunit KdpA [Deltaproteobacteria bacterium]
TANSPFYDLTLAVAMFVGRFAVIIPMLAVAGSLSQKKVHPAGDAAFPVHGVLFVTLLIGVIILVGALTFFPTLTLGPVLEHLEMLRGAFY